VHSYDVIGVHSCDKSARLGAHFRMMVNWLCVLGCSEGNSSSWNDSTSKDDNESGAGLDRSATSDDSDPAGTTEQLGSRQCRTNDDCEGSVGVSCYWLYDGCQTGRCMCDPRRHLQSIDGHCIPCKILPLQLSLLVAINYRVTGRLRTWGEALDSPQSFWDANAATN